MRLVSNLIINTLALLIVSYIIPGFRLDNLTSALVAAVMIGLVNTFIKPLIVLITLPLNFLTLGLFTFIINILMLFLAAALTPGFHIDGILTALLGSILLSLVSSFLNTLAK